MMVLVFFIWILENESGSYFGLTGENKNVNIRIDLFFGNVHEVLNASKLIQYAHAHLNSRPH